MLQLIPIPPIIWKNISMEFVIGLAKSINKSFIMVLADHLPKYARFCAFQHLFMTSRMAQFFMDNIFKLHGMPHSIVSESNPTFTNNFWKQIFKIKGTQLHLSMSYHLHIDGQIEAVKKFLETYL